MNLSQTIKPKNSDGILRVIIPARISTDKQDFESNFSQHSETERKLREVYDGELKIEYLSDQASGWIADRESMEIAKSLIGTGSWDLVAVSELRELYRNPGFLWAFVHFCIDHDTRFVSFSDQIDTAEDNWEITMHIATLRHGMAVPEVRQRVRRKATHSFSQGEWCSK